MPDEAILLMGVPYLILEEIASLTCLHRRCRSLAKTHSVGVFETGCSYCEMGFLHDAGNLMVAFWLMPVMTTCVSKSPWKLMGLNSPLKLPW